MKPPKYPGVYAIVHIASGRRYIGSAKNIYRRWREHKSDLRRKASPCLHLQRAWTKYGEAAFQFEVIEACLKDPVLLCAREQFWIDYFKRSLLNIRRFADPAFGVSWSPERKSTASQRMTGNTRCVGKFFIGKLAESDVKSILARYAAGEAREAIAADFGVTIGHLCRITSRRFYSRIEIVPEIDAACRERSSCRARGKRNTRSKLADHVNQIRERIRNGESDSVIAKDLKVTPRAIKCIRQGKTYGYLGGGPATG